MHFGVWEIILILALVLILFGARRIPELMKGLGTGVREFKTGLKGDEDKNVKKEEKDDKSKD